MKRPFLSNPENMTIKRLAWAYGCSKKDTEDERTLFRALVERILALGPALFDDADLRGGKP